MLENKVKSSVLGIVFALPDMFFSELWNGN